MQSGDAADSAMDVVSTVSSSHTSSAHSSATVGTAQGGGGGGAASTPFLIMQQQQRDSALNKRQHSGVMGSFFAVSAIPSVALLDVPLLRCYCSIFSCSQSFCLLF